MSVPVGQEAALWVEYSAPIVALFIVALAVLVFVYGLGNRVAPEPVFIDLQAQETGRKQPQKKKKTKGEKKAKKQAEETPSADSPAEGDSPAEEPAPQPAVETSKPAKDAPAKSAKPSPAPAKTAKEAAAKPVKEAKPAKKEGKPAEKADDWSKVTSKKSRRGEQEEVADSAAQEALTLVSAGGDNAEESADSGIASASPNKTKKKKKKKTKSVSQDVEETAVPAVAPAAPKPAAPVVEAVVAKAAAPKVTAPSKPKADEFTTVSKKKKGSSKKEEAAATEPAGTKLTAADLYGSGNGKRILSLEEAMAVVMQQQNEAAAAPPAAATPAPPPTPVVEAPAPALAPKAAPAPRPAAAPAPQLAPKPAPPPAVAPGKPLTIEEMMARLQAGEDITQIATAQLAAATNGSAAPAQPTNQKQETPVTTKEAPPVKDNVAFDELGDAWTESKPKPKKRRSRKD